MASGCTAPSNGKPFEGVSCVVRSAASGDRQRRRQCVKVPVSLAEDVIFRQHRDVVHTQRLQMGNLLLHVFRAIGADGYPGLELHRFRISICPHHFLPQYLQLRWNATFKSSKWDKSIGNVCRSCNPRSALRSDPNRDRALHR